MLAKFKEPYCGAKTIYDFSTPFAYCAFRSYDRRWIYFNKYMKVDRDWVDKDGVVWIENAEGYLVENHVTNIP